MKRKIEVEATVYLSYEIDDEVKSEWDEATILTVLEKRGKGNDIYTDRATLETLLGDLGFHLSVENRSISRIDGWADFPDSAASGSPYGVDWTYDRVYVDGEPVTT